MAITAQNEEVVLLPSLARSSTAVSGDLQNLNGSKLNLIVNTTAIGSATLLVTIDAKDAASGTYYNILTGASITTNTLTRYRIGPELVASANSIAQDILPPVFRITVTQGGSGNATYSVGYTLARG